MNTTQEQVGCEPYLYLEIKCCLHDCSAKECPEPICASEFPGGKKAYLRYKELQGILRSGLDLYKAAEMMKISKDTALILFNKGKKMAVNR